MRKSLVVVLFSVLNLFQHQLLAQVPVIEWSKCYGGTANENGYFIQQTNDDGYIVAGTTLSSDGDITLNHGSYDFWIVKLNNSGIIQWQKSLGGTGGEVASEIQQTNDGGYIIAGSSSTSNDGDVTDNNGLSDYWIVKLDSTGSIQWQESYGGMYNDKANSIQQTTDGGYIIAGSSSSNDGDVSGHHGQVGANYADYWIVKIDADGDIQWQKSLGGTSADIANCIKQTNDGGYIISGFSLSLDGDITGHHGTGGYALDYWVVKIDSVGTIQWQKSLGGFGSDDAYEVHQTIDNGYIVVGSSTSNDGDITAHHGTADYYDYWIVKLDENGTIQWDKSLGGTSDEYAFSIKQTSDGGYIVAGSADSNDGDVIGNPGVRNEWIVKLDNSGIIQWQKSLGGSSSDDPRSIVQTSDWGYIIAGSSSSDDGDVSGNNGQYDYWIVKLSGSVGIENINSKLINPTLFPNPATTEITVQWAGCSTQSEVTIYNTQGQMVFNSTSDSYRNDIQHSTPDSYRVDISSFPSGLYYLQLFDAKGALVKTEKVVKE